MRETKMENGKIQLLDCTLRDGGQGLEAAYRTEGSKTVFTEQMINDIVDHLSRTDIEIVELGYIEKSHFANHPFANHFSVEEVSKFIPKTPNKKQMYIALFTGPDMDEGQIPEWNPSLIEGVRVILRYSELEKSLDYCEMLARKGYKTFVQPMISGKLDYNGTVDYIIHTAAITNSKLMVSNPVDTIRTSIYGTEAVLELAREKNAAMVYVSSMEVYGNPNLTHEVSEEDYGYINLSNVRSSYPESKRMCECLCTAYASQYGVQVCTARLAQTFGAGILATENRVFAQFARSAISGSDIVLHTLGQSEGNYVYTSDAIRALLLLIIFGESGQAYNVANEKSHLTIVQMADMVLKNFGNSNAKVVFDIPEDSMKYGYAPSTKMHLSAKKIENIGWHAQIDLEESYRRMIEYMKETEEKTIMGGKNT